MAAEELSTYPKTVTGEIDQAVEHAPVAGSAGEQLRAFRARLRRAVDLLRSLTEADLRFRYGRAPSRFVRSLMEPFALAGVYLLLITFFLNRPGTPPAL